MIKNLNQYYDTFRNDIVLRTMYHIIEDAFGSTPIEITIKDYENTYDGHTGGITANFLVDGVEIIIKRYSVIAARLHITDTVFLTADQCLKYADNLHNICCAFERIKAYIRELFEHTEVYDK